MTDVWVPMKAAQLIIWALDQVGKAYRFGTEARLDASDFDNVRGFAWKRDWDCSELVQCGLWACGITEVGDTEGRKTPIAAFDGAWKQWEKAVHIAFEAAVRLPGALLFGQSPQEYPGKPHHIGHVAISLGNSYVVEARGTEYGVCISRVRPIFKLGAKVRELYVPITALKGG